MRQEGPVNEAVNAKQVIEETDWQLLMLGEREKLELNLTQWHQRRRVWYYNH